MSPRASQFAIRTCAVICGSVAVVIVATVIGALSEVIRALVAAGLALSFGLTRGQAFFAASGLLMFVCSVALMILLTREDA